MDLIEQYNSTRLEYQQIDLDFVIDEIDDIENENDILRVIREIKNRV